nr:MAG TPA: peptidoglycan hydrolase [Caudoviricetes sp.]
MAYTNIELANKLKDIAQNYKTLYVMGCFGAPMTAANKRRYTQNHSYNKQASRTAMINAASADTFGFDCVCLIKGVLWGWNGSKTATYGGAKYACNGVPDIGADSMINVCKNISTDFSKIEVGEAVWMSGHIGVYIGEGLAVECTPKWANKVQITACNCSKSGYNRRNWTKHGKLPYITYVQQTDPVTPAKPETPSSDTTFKKGDLVKITGTKYLGGKTIPLWVRLKKWYVLEGGSKRVVIDKSEDGKNSICSAVSADCLQLVKSTSSKSVDELAREVINGKWGNGSARKKKLTAAGYDYGAVQKRVNELMK